MRIDPAPALPGLAGTIFANVSLRANSLTEDIDGKWVKEAARLQSWTAKPARRGRGVPGTSSADAPTQFSKSGARELDQSRSLT